MKQTIYDLTFEQLAGWLEARGHRKFRAQQVWDWLYRKRATSFDAMEGVNAGCLELLRDHFRIVTLAEHVKQQSADGTVKFLFRLSDGHLIETVLMRHKFGLSVCVTTQVGCNIGCSFCASGLIAKQRDLTSGEIAEQVVTVQRFLDAAGQNEKVSHIVVMGIGEPFDNYEHVMNFLRIVIDHKGLAIGGRHITVSTSGLEGKIRTFADSGMPVNLAISLHAPTDELRTRIMKINRAIPLDKLMAAIDYYLAATKRRLTLEYILLRDVNDRREHAEQLADLIADRRELVNVNLIPYNPVDEHSQYQRSDKETIRAFYDTLKKRQVSCSVRLEHGTDIDAACGQLRSKQMQATPAPLET
ncbi:MAG: 23S rRNA (adenine(2503)-C(2))-methyltransferase RlmN [Paenibacillaceae bacterium]|nr:23S rRNA (adenine(2503)-C(2))-methyltransferase RlmN [Paenibacillaceae bacterium]